MNLTKLMSWSDAFTDETQITSDVLAYANQAIAKINTKYNLSLPFFETIEEEYTALPDSWIVRLILNFMNYGIKMKDASLSEAAEYKNEFDLAMYDFGGVDRRSFIDEVYFNDGSKSVYVIDTSTAIDVGWFAGNNQGSGW